MSQRSPLRRPRPAPPGRRLRACLAVWSLVLIAGPSLAFAPDAPTPPEASTLSAPVAPDIGAVIVRAAAGDVTGTTVMERIGERLRRLPLRPVMIGEEPRTPDDPEPGAGLTIFIRF